MLSLSPLSGMTTDDDEPEDDYLADDRMTTTSDNDRRAVDASVMDADGIASRLAFTYDLTNLDEEGKPKNKLARK